MTVLCFAPMLASKNDGRSGDKTGPAFWRSAAELAFWNLGIKVCATSLFYSRTPRE